MVPEATAEPEMARRRRLRPAEQPARRAAAGAARRRFDLLPYALVTPLILFIVGLALVPAVFTVGERSSGYSRSTRRPNSTGWTTSDTCSRTPPSRSIGNTVLYVVIGVTLSTVLAIAMAVTLQKKFRGRSVLIAVLILPWALPGVVEGIVWSSIWDSNTGLLNSVLTSFHLIDHYQVFSGPTVS